MRYFWMLVIALLTFLAISSGVTKVMQMPQDVEFFGRYGFSNLMIVAFGVLQISGGVMLAIPKTRIAGAVTVSLTFFLSLVLLIIDKNVPFSLFTIVALIALVAVVVRSK